MNAEARGAQIQNPIDARILVMRQLWALSPEPINQDMQQCEIEAAQRRVIHRLAHQSTGFVSNGVVRVELV